MIASRKARLKKYENKLDSENQRTTNKTRVKTYLYPTSCGGTNATIQDYRQHGEARPGTKTIATKIIANTTGSQPPMGQHEKNGVKQKK